MSQYKLEKLVIKPTLACTANCPTCQLRKQLHRDLANARKLSFEQWMTIFADASKLGVKRLDISGGEPTLYKRLTDLIRAGKQYGWFVNVNTNGSLINEEYAQRLLAAGLDSVSISIYSADPEVHDEMRCHPGLWQKATRAVRIFSQLREDYPNFSPLTQTLLCRENFRDLRDLIELHYSLGSDRVAFTYLEGDFEGKYLLNEAEIAEFRRGVMPDVRAFCATLDPAVRGEAVRVVESVYSETINSTANFAKGLYRPPELGLPPCQRPKNFTILLANGDVHPCNMVEYSHEPIMGNLFEKSLPEIWHSEKWNRFRETLFDYCRLCPINLYMAIPLRPRRKRVSAMPTATVSRSKATLPALAPRDHSAKSGLATKSGGRLPREDDCPNLMESQHWPYTRLLAFQNERLRYLLDYAYTQIPGYRRKFQEAGLTPADIRSQEDLQRLPITTREELQENEDFVNRALVRRTMYTGGSTGTSLQYYESEVAGRVRWNAHLRGWKWGGYEPGMRCCIVKSAQSIVKEGNVIHLVGDLTEENLAKNLEVVRSFRPQHLKGYVGSLYILAKYCLDRGIRLQGVVSAIPSSENLYDEQRHVIEEAFNCKVLEEYCCNDGGACAWECEKREGLHYFMERAIIEDVEGKQIVTDLWNYAMPFIRYENGDSVRFLGRKCSCGRELPLIRVKGRANDIIITRQGVITPTFLMHHGIGLVGADKKGPNFRSGIRTVQYVQKPGYRLEVNVVRNPWCTDADIENLKKDVRRFSGGMELSIRFVDRVWTTKKGKTSFIINEDKELLAQYLGGELEGKTASFERNSSDAERISVPTESAGTAAAESNAVPQPAVCAELRSQNTHTPKVSVLLCAYNGERFIRQALQSIYDQTYQDFEVVIVDDASNDATPEILREMKDSRTVIYRNAENQGLTKSLNIGLRFCRGEYVARMDADDVSHERRFEKEVEVLDTHPRCLAVGTWCHRIDEEGRIVGQWKPRTTSEEIRERLMTTNAVVHGSAMIRRAALVQAGGYDDSYEYAQDYDLWLRLSERGDILNVPEHLYSLRSSSEAISTRLTSEQDACAARARQAAEGRRTASAPSKTTTRKSNTRLINCESPAPSGSTRKQMRKTLDDIACRHRTDKCSLGHNYTPYYAKWFEPVRGLPLKILEIGIGMGASLRTWQEYFPNAEITGIDIHPDRRRFADRRIRICIGDQTDENFLRSVVEEAGGAFDIIIDDGGHFMNQQIISFNVLFPYVKPGGIYVVEDLHTSYRTGFGGGENRPDTMVEMLKGFVDVVNRHGKKAKGSSPQAWLAADQAEPESIAKQIASIEFGRSICFMRKRADGTLAALPNSAAPTVAATPSCSSKISVVLTTYNRPEFLEKVLGGFAAQTAAREDFEVIVVDDGSVPPVKEMVSRFGGAMNLKYLYQENCGLAAARNAGIHAAEGDIILFSDDDDVPAPELVAEHLRGHREHTDECVAVLGHLDWHSNLQVTPLMHYVTHVGGEYFGFDKLQHGQFYNQWKWWGGLVSAKRSLLQSVEGPFDTRLCFGYEDTELVCRLLPRQIRVLYNARARSFVLRPVTFDDFCRRSYKQGRALHRVAAVHPEIIIPRYQLENAGAEYRGTYAASLDEWTAKVAKFEAVLAQEAAAPDSITPRHLEALYTGYRECFRGHLLKGYVEELEAVERGQTRISDAVNANATADRPTQNPLSRSDATDCLAEAQDRAIDVTTENRPRRITFVNSCTPAYDMGSSNLRIYYLLKILVEQGHTIDHLQYVRYAEDARYKAAFDGAIRFIENGPTATSFVDYLHFNRVDDLDCVWITNLWTPAYVRITLEVARWLRRHRPGVRIIVDTMDFHAKKYMRRFELSQDRADLAKAQEFLELEKALYPLADLVLAVTEVERQNILDNVSNDLNVAVIPNIHTVPVEIPAVEQRRHLCFLGAFKVKHNLDAVRWFCREVFPLILRDVPDVEFHIFGYGNEDRRDEIPPHPNVKVIGYVEDAERTLSDYRLFVCPMLYGAGMKGKMGVAAGVGTPIVTTTIGAEGFGLTDGRDCFVTDDAQDFARKCVQLLRDDALWRTFSTNARRLMDERFSVEAVGRQVDALLGQLPWETNTSDGPAASVASATASASEPTGPPQVSIVTSCHNCQEYLAECLDSIRSQTMRDWELLLIDDGSTDGTRKIIEEYSQSDSRIRPLCFDENAGPYVRRNQAIRQARTEFIVIQDADDVMSPSKLEILFDGISAHPELAVVGSRYRTFLGRFKGLEYTDVIDLPVDHDEIVDKCATWTHGFSHGAAIIRKSLFDQIGLYDENPFASDSFWSAKLAEYTRHNQRVRLANVSDYLTLVRVHTTNQTQLLPTFDPRSRRTRYHQYCECKLREIRQKAQTSPATDVAAELRNCDCSDFLRRFRAHIIKWESEPVQSEAIQSLLETAVALFNHCCYVSCVSMLNGVEVMDRTILQRFANLDLLKAISFYALDMKEQALFHLRREIDNHQSAAGAAFLRDYFENGLEIDVQKWCAERADQFDLQIVDTGKTDSASIPSSTAGLQKP